METEDHSAGSGSYQVVARRYRPKTFEELVGQGHIAQALSNALTSGRVGHAYLFTGARGVGKTSTARIFAKALNCVEGPTLTPCGVCDSCRNVSVGEDIDVLEIDGASNRGIDEIRQLRQNASICPSRSKFKIYIIDEVHMLTREAFNALLKILEEPPEHVKFIFCTTEPSKIPITILSRCQRFDFAGIESSAIAGRLAAIASDEKVTADDGVFEMLARRAAGSMRDAQSLLEQLLSFAPEHIALADVHEMLGTANDQLLFRLIDAMTQCNPATIFMELDAAASEGVDFGILVEQLMGIFRDLLVTASGGDASLLLFCSPMQAEQLKNAASTFGLHRILASLQILDQTHSRMRYSTQGRVLTELALVRMAHLDHFQMISVLIDNIRAGNLPISPQVAESAQTVMSVQAVPAAPKPMRRTVSAPPPNPQTSIPAPQSPASQLQVSPSTNHQPPPTSNLTPQQRLAAAAAPAEIDIDRLDHVGAKKLWCEVADTIPGMLGRWAANCRSVSFEKPNLFKAVFSNKAAKDFCEKESPELQSVLSRTLGRAVRIQFELKEEPEKKEAFVQEKKNTSTLRSAAEQGRMLKKASENEFVRKIEEVFGAELHDIK